MHEGVVDYFKKFLEYKLVEEEPNLFELIHPIITLEENNMLR